MQKRRLSSFVRTMPLAALFVIAMAVPVAAESSTSSSANYQLTESQFGAGSSAESCSTQYCARVSIGDSAGGNISRSPNVTAFSSETGTDPLLEVIIEPGISNLGVLNTETTATKTMKVKVRSYLSSGYVMQIVGNPPTYGGHTLKTSSTLSGATPGKEQFGINAVANTTPSVGANPVQVPSEGTSFGEIMDGYNVPNQFKYVNGDVVARSRTESGQTDYTISMIVNISSATPAGHYSGDFSAVVVPIY